MKVHLIRKETIKHHVAGNARSKPSFAVWLTAVKYADWNVPLDIMQTFGSADLLRKGSNRVVFNMRDIITGRYANMYSVAHRFIYSFAGLEHVLNTITSVTTKNNTQ